MRPPLIMLVKFQAVFKLDITWDYVSIIHILFDLASFWCVPTRFRFHHLLPFLIVSIPHKAERRFLWRLCGAEDIGRHRLKTTYDDRFSTIQSCSPVADLARGGARGPTPPPVPSLYTKLRPEGPKNSGGATPLSQGLDYRIPPPPPPNLNDVWIGHFQ